MPDKVAEMVFAGNPGAKYVSQKFQAGTVCNGTELEYGGYRLECLEMPGHTPGHICLYDRQKKLIFLGDHVLFDITPNITAWDSVADSLGNYLTSLHAIRELEIEKAFPAHRNPGKITVKERIDQIIHHHQLRLDECENIVRMYPDMNAYEIAGKMTWKIRCNSWDDFPAGQKLFAIGEALAHLDYLTQRGRLIRITNRDGKAFYRINE